jgi:alkylhydroperoxidase family enzyme
MTTTAPVTTWLPGGDDDLLALIPKAYAQLGDLYAGLWDAGVDPVTLELCRLRVAALIGSAADLAVRDARAVAAGLSDETVEALASWTSSPLITDAQRAVLSFAEQYVLDAHGVTDADTAALHLNFSPDQLATLTTAVAVFDALARVRTILSVDAGGSGLALRPAGIGVALRASTLDESEEP